MVTLRSSRMPADQVAEHVDFLVVEAAGGFVEQQDLRSAASARASSTRFWVPNGRPETVTCATSSR